MLMSNASKALLTASLCLGSSSIALADDAFARDPLWGAYQNTSVGESAVAINHAVDKATDDLSVFVRGIARKRLKEVNPPYEHILLSERDGEITTDFEGRRYVADASGQVRRNVDPDGSKVEVAYRLEGRTLHGRYKAKDGEKAIDFVLGPDGRTLDVRVQVTSPRLPEPVSYDLTYSTAS